MDIQTLLLIIIVIMLFSIDGMFEWVFTIGFILLVAFGIMYYAIGV